jgi:diacylglycerol kinase family enzyme
VTVVVQNAGPYTYFASRPMRVVAGAALDSGGLSLGALKRATPLEVATLLPRLLSGSAKVVQNHRHIAGFEDVREAVIEAVDGEPFPLQVDGDYIGERTRVEYGISPAGLSVVS